MRTVQEAADQTLSSVPGFISTLGQSYHSPDGMGCRHVYWSSWEEHRPLSFSIVRKRSLVSHVPYVPSRYSHDSPLHLFSATVGSDLSRVRSLHSTRSLSFKGIPFLAMKSICASAVLTYEQAVQGLTWRTAFLTEE